MRERFSRFMQGRYGVDQFSNFLVILALIFMVLELFIPVSYVRSGLNSLGLLLLIYAYFRIFSKNHYKRYAENERYMKYYNKVRFFLQGKRIIWSREERIVSISVLPAGNPSAYQKERERLQSPVQNAGQNLLERVSVKNFVSRTLCDKEALRLQ